MAEKIMRHLIQVVAFLLTLLFFSLFSGARDYLLHGQNRVLGYGGALTQVTVSAPAGDLSNQGSSDTISSVQEVLTSLSQDSGVAVLYIPDTQVPLATLADPGGVYAQDISDSLGSLADPTARKALVLSHLSPVSYPELLPHGVQVTGTLPADFPLDRLNFITGFTTPAVQPFSAGTYYLSTSDPLATERIKRLAEKEGYSVEVNYRQEAPSLLSYPGSTFGVTGFLTAFLLCSSASALCLIYLLGRQHALVQAICLGASRGQAIRLEIAKNLPGLLLASAGAALACLPFCLLNPSYFPWWLCPLAATVNLCLWVAVLWFFLLLVGRRIRNVLPC